MIVLLVDKECIFVRKENVALESFQAAIKHLFAYWLKEVINNFTGHGS